MSFSLLSLDEALGVLRKKGIRIGKDTLSYGLQQEKFPFGIAIKADTKWRYLIFEKDLNEWINEHIKEE